MTKTKLISHIALLIVIVFFVWIIGDILVGGLQNISLNFLVEAPFSAGRKGGILPIIVSTLLILFLTITFVLPMGVLCALYLFFYNNKFFLRLIYILSGVPSIVFGLFGNVLFCEVMGLGFSILSGALTLTLMALPLFITTFLEGLKQVPQGYLKTLESLAIGKYTAFKKILLPQSSLHLIMALSLSLGRASAETAALIFTSGYVDRMPESIFDSGRSLSVHIYDLSMNVPGGNTNALNSAFILIILIILINILISKTLAKVRRFE